MGGLVETSISDGLGTCTEGEVFKWVDGVEEELLRLCTTPPFTLPQEAEMVSGI